MYCLCIRLSCSIMKENELFSFIPRAPVVLIALDSALVGFGPTLPEEEQMFHTTMNGKKVWVIEDGAAFTLMYPEDY